jgi:cytochrome c-type protein NapC
MRAFLKSPRLKWLAAGAAAGVLAVAAFGGTISLTSKTAFCISCHEMQLVAEQGWMRSRHYNNDHGVVAQCSDCHVEPDLIPMIHTKVRDGTTDIFVHVFGVSNPHEMDWRELQERARVHSGDTSCRRCHGNMTPKWAPIKMIVAHREYGRMNGAKKCVDCHRTEFHGEFFQYLEGARE